MSDRNLDAFFKAAINSTTNGGVVTKLVEITHPLRQPLRWTQNNEPILSNGNIYIQKDFRATLVDQRPEEINNGILTVSNIDRSFLAYLSELPDGVDPVITLSIILATQPDSPQISVSYTCNRWNWNRRVVNAALDIKFPYLENIPSARFTADKFPGLFRT
jgi:hypothetical protein